MTALNLKPLWIDMINYKMSLMGNCFDNLLNFDMVSLCLFHIVLVQGMRLLIEDMMSWFEDMIDQYNLDMFSLDKINKGFEVMEYMRSFVVNSINLVIECNLSIRGFMEIGWCWGIEKSL